MSLYGQTLLRGTNVGQSVGHQSTVGIAWGGVQLRRADTLQLVTLSKKKTVQVVSGALAA